MLDGRKEIIKNKFMIFLIEKIMAFLPKIISWWLYQEKRTIDHINTNISAQEGSCEIYCFDLSTFTIWIEIINKNPFDIDVDRVLIKGNFNQAKLYAENLIGVKIRSNSSEKLPVIGDIDTSQIKHIKASDDNTTFSGEVKMVLNNKYRKLRHRQRIERIMCKVINKKNI